MTVGEFLNIPCEENVEFIMINYRNNYDNISFTKNKLTHEKYLKKDTPKWLTPADSPTLSISQSALRHQ